MVDIYLFVFLMFQWERGHTEAIPFDFCSLWSLSQHRRSLIKYQNYWSVFFSQDRQKYMFLRSLWFLLFSHMFFHLEALFGLQIFLWYSVNYSKNLSGVRYQLMQGQSTLMSIFKDIFQWKFWDGPYLLETAWKQLRKLCSRLTFSRISPVPATDEKIKQKQAFLLPPACHIFTSLQAQPADVTELCRALGAPAASHAQQSSVLQEPQAACINPPVHLVVPVSPTDWGGREDDHRLVPKRPRSESSERCFQKSFSTTRGCIHLQARDWNVLGR